MSITMPGSGKPIVPALSGFHSSGTLVPAGEVSVMPHPPTRRWPVSLWNCSPTSTGSGAPPELTRRSEERSRCAMSGVLASAIHMVGTPGNTVARFTSMSWSVVAASKRSRSISSQPSG